MSKPRKDRDGSTGAMGRITPIEKASASADGPRTSPERVPMDMSQTDREERIARARQRISEGYYDRDEVRRAIAEALVFMLSARRD